MPYVNAYECILLFTKQVLAMPPGRCAGQVYFWISSENTDKVTLLWSEDGWSREFDMDRSGILFTKTLYPLKDGQRIEFKFKIYKQNSIEWKVNREIRVDKNPEGIENNIIYMGSD
jgi:hypothetical protein